MFILCLFHVYFMFISGAGECRHRWLQQHHEHGQIQRGLLTNLLLGLGQEGKETHFNPYAAGTKFGYNKMIQKTLEMTETLANWYSSARAIQWIPTWRDLYGFQKYLRPCALDESNLSIERVKNCLSRTLIVYWCYYWDAWMSFLWS